jgi:hypothetical protein
MTVEPVYSLSLLGGQYFFGGERGHLAGNFSAPAAPGMKFNDEWEFFPSVSGSYQGTKQVIDLVGAGTVFQEQMDYRVGLKPVYSPGGGPWRVKPSYGFRTQLLKETKEETWTGGLFDYRRHDFGLEGEFVYQDPFSVRASFDYAMTNFPNYSSLESKAAFDFQGQSLARELVGDKVLDSDALLFGLAASAPWRAAVFEFGYTFLSQDFPNQHVVDLTGGLTSPLRSDSAHLFSAGVKAPIPLSFPGKMIGSFGLAYTLSSSNQNNYDALRTQFQEGYYDFSEFRLSPGARYMAGNPDRPVTFGLGFDVWLRDYPNRRVQDSAGTYQADTLSQTNWMVSASVSRPIAPRMRLLFDFSYGAASSNMGYESLYKYSYTAMNYLFGVSYDL